MDSMVGYRNQRMNSLPMRARLDDAELYPRPPLCPGDDFSQRIVRMVCSNAWRIWRRDRRKHASPNSAQAEAVMAGALGTAGRRCLVFGKLHPEAHHRRCSQTH